MCVMTLASAVILCSVATLKGFQGERFMGRPLGGDFVQFYAAGRVLMTPGYQAWRIYDVTTMNAMEHEVNPQLQADRAPVFGGAPVAAALLAPLTVLPYRFAYVAWLCISFSLAALSIRRLAKDWLPEGDRGLALLAGLAFPLFCFESWMGQISVLGLVIFAHFLHFLKARKSYVAGFVLAFCAYKPSMLVFPAAVLLIRHRKEFVGMLAGLATFVGLCFGVVGFKGMAAWADVIMFYTHFADGTIAGKIHHKYLDSVSFFSLMQVPHARIVALACGAALAIALFARLIKPGLETPLAWAATICVSMVANSYTPSYDGVLLIPAAFLAAGAVKNRNEIGLWLTALFLTAWVTQLIAEVAHVQLLTILLAAFGLRILGFLGSRVPVQASAPRAAMQEAGV